MSKYLVETFYTCSFKIVHKLEELNEKNLSELENRKDGRFEIIDVKLNNRKTKKVDEKSNDIPLSATPKKDISDISSIINKKNIDSKINLILISKIGKTLKPKNFGEFTIKKYLNSKLY